jgi:outer membrane protein TolC
MIAIQKYLLKTSLIGLCGCVLFFSQAGHAETLREAMSAALQYHPSVDAVTAMRQGLQDKKVEEWAAQFPEINVTATGGRVYGDNATSRGLAVTRGSGYSYLWEGTAGLSQKIFDGFETSERIAAAEDRLRSADLEVVDVRENLVLQTARAYFDVMRSKEALDMVAAHNKQIEDYRERIAMMVDEGVADQAELKLSEDITILLDNIYEDYQSQYLAAQAMYQQLTGYRPSGQMDLPEWDHSHFPSSLEEASGVLVAHPSMKAADYQIDASAHDVEAEKPVFTRM